MLPPIANSQKGKQPKPKDSSVQDEINIQNDNDLQPMGNEAANDYYTRLLREANEDNMLDFSEYEGLDENSLKEEKSSPDSIINNKLNESENSLGESNRGMGEKSSPANIIYNKLNERENSLGESDRGMGEKSYPFNIINNKPNESENSLGESDRSIDLDNSMYLNSSHNIVNENTLERLAEKKKDKLKKGEKKPDQKVIKNVIEFAEEIAEDQPQPKDTHTHAKPDTYASDEDMVVQRGKKRKKSSDKGPVNRGIVENADAMADEHWKSAARERLENMQFRDQDERKKFLDEEMGKLKDWDFQPQKIGEIKKSGKFRKFLSYLAAGIGKLVRLPLTILTLGHFWRGKSLFRRARRKTTDWQQRKDYDTIPGWNGAEFDPNATSGEDIMADFRRVPTVWSRLTAAKAADKVVKDGKETEKPLDPIISVMVDQPKSNSSRSMLGREVGHTMIGIEYSRKSLISGRYERYKLQYGFYPADGAQGMSSIMTSLKRNMTVPGELHDDARHKYDVSRRYPASPKQVSEIFKASEKYAEGGYNIYNRNCTTFVKDMVDNTAHLETGEGIFKTSDVRFSSLANLGLFAGEAFKQNAKAGTENVMMDFSEQESNTYQNYGNMVATEQDWINYKNSMKESSGIIKQTISPAETGERLRRMNKEGTGEIGSFKFNAPLKDNNGELTLNLISINEAIEKYAMDIQEKFQTIFPMEQRGNMPYEVLDISSKLSAMGSPLTELKNKILNYANKNKIEGTFNHAYALNSDDLRKAREDLSKYISEVSILQMNYLKNDERFHNQLLNLISLLNYAVNYVDDLYTDSIRGGDKQDKVTDIRENITHSTITMKAGEAEADFLPTHYESYIQIYKTPEKAVKAYSRYKFLKEKKERSGKWTEDFFAKAGHKFQNFFSAEDAEGFTVPEAREFKKLQKMETLALEFDKSHNYMIEKEAYSQQDVDYAFRLQKKEQNGVDMQDPETYKAVNQYKTAGGIYITLFMDQIFKDMKETFMKKADEGGGPDEPASDKQAVQVWFDKYLTERANQKKEEFNQIVKGIYRSMKGDGPDRKEVQEKDVLKKLTDVILSTCINKNFNGLSDINKESEGQPSLTMALQNIMDNKKSQFTTLVRKMFMNCQTEEMEQMHLF